MFFITYSALWSLSYFFTTVYFIFVISAILYALACVKEFVHSTKFRRVNRFLYLTGFDIYWILITPIALCVIINFAWAAPTVSAWFGNLVFSGFQYKISYLVIAIFYILITVYCTSFYFSSKEVYDYVSVCFNFFLWIYFLFTANTLFTVIFFIEILSTLITLLVVTASFSTTYFYNNLNLNLHNYFNNTTPVFFIQMLLYFFWISLISSLNLFIFLILFYIKFASFDWFILEFVLFYIVQFAQIKDLVFLALIWLNLLFCIFLKCGLVPFYFWKPAFFKGIPVHALFFYITFFYFFIFLFFIYFFLIATNEIFYFFLSVNIGLLIVGFFMLLFMLCEAYYIKAFLALSSILNSLFVFLALNSVNTVDVLFFL